MKKILYSLVMIFIATSMNIPLSAQNCKFFFPTKVGTTLEQTYYNQRGKVQSVQTQTVTDRSQKGDTTVVMVEQTIVSGKKKEEGMKTDYEVKCADGKFFMNMESMLSGMDMDQMQQSPDMQMSVTTDGLYFPTDMHAGETLPPATIKMSMGASGFNMMNITITMKNRKVEGRESITTPAGTYDCYKISYNTETKSMMKIDTKNVLWLAEDVGVVRSETYNSRGKLQGYQELTAVRK